MIVYIMSFYVCITVFKVAMNKIIHLGNSTFEAVQNREIR